MVRSEPTSYKSSCSESCYGILKTFVSQLQMARAPQKIKKKKYDFRSSKVRRREVGLIASFRFTENISEINEMFRA